MPMSLKHVLEESPVRRRKGKKTGRAIMRRAQATKLGSSEVSCPLTSPKEKAQIEDVRMR